MSVARRNFLVVWCSNFITAVGMMGFLPFIALYLREIGVTDDASVKMWAGIIIAAAPLPAAFMGPVWGVLGDRKGRKLMMLRANSAIVVFVGLMATVGSPWQLLALRLGQGVFSGFIAPAMTLVSVSTPPEKQGRTAAYLQTAIMAGGIIGPLMGGAIATEYGYRAVFVVCSAFSMVAILLVSLFVVEPEESRRQRKQLGEGTEPAGLLRTALTDTLDFLRSPVLRVVLAGAFAVRFGASLLDPVIALWVETRSGFPPDQLNNATGLVVGAQAVATLLFTPVWGRIGDRLGNRRLLAICASGAAVLYIAQRFADHVTLLAVLRFASGAFVAGVVPAAFSAAAHNSPPERRGAAQGVTFSVVVLARALAPVGGGLVSASFGLGALFWLAGGLMVVTAAATFVSASTQPASAGDPTPTPAPAERL